METKTKKGPKIVLELDHKANLMVLEKQMEMFRANGKKPTKQEAILILIKQ
jgi:hypothetical protein